MGRPRWLQDLSTHSRRCHAVPGAGSGLPLEGSCQEGKLSLYTIFLRCFCSCVPSCSYMERQRRRTLVFVPCGVAQLPGSAPVTHRDQGPGRVCPLAGPFPAPGNVVAPENRRYHAASKKGDHRSWGSRVGPTPGWLTAWAYPLSHLNLGGCWRDGTAANQVWWLQTNPFTGSLPQPHRPSSKGLRSLKRHLVPHHVVAGSRQLMRHRLDGHHAVSLLLLPLIIPFDLGVVAHRKVGSLHKRPR
jgi:hypothetical protein